MDGGWIEKMEKIDGWLDGSKKYGWAGWIKNIVGVLLQPPIPIFHFLQETVKTVFFCANTFHQKC